MEKKTKATKKAKLPARKLSISISGAAGVMLDRFCANQERTPSWTVNGLILDGLDCFAQKYGEESGTYTVKS